MNQTTVGSILATVIASGILWVGFSLSSLQTGVARIEERIVSVQSGMMKHEDRIKDLETEMAKVRIHHAREAADVQDNAFAPH